jgi:tetratricopeptide (TPR) repeat protein
MCAGHYAEALQLLNKALPLDPLLYHADYEFDLAVVHLELGKRDRAVDEAKQVLIHQPDLSLAHSLLAVVFSDEGREQEARAEAAKWLKLVGPLTIAKMRELDQKMISVRAAHNANTGSIHCVSPADRRKAVNEDDGKPRLQQVEIILERGEQYALALYAAAGAADALRLVVAAHDFQRLQRNKVFVGPRRG